MAQPDFDAQMIRPESPAPRSLDSERVMIADLDDERRLRYTATLEDAGYAVVPVGDVAQALEQADAAQPVLILAYLTDPKADGPEWCRKVRRDPHTRAIPFVVVTAFGDPFTREQIVRAGASGILIEPFNRALLLRHVRRQIARAKSHAPQRS